ncbi:5-formyltetrahydrofolate cyclo-ligase [Cupriavidus gilardii]|uniref:5-formyltetrahydrofolate cyclo-ligase n=1 Tax=Cupriavidus gilardii TaxID=82541 RepID=UPI001ABE4C05|nr:5-formyltetrahydrofolate cyclo-ligase [Cupriavidus gilardii]MBO4119300.1 5-formyltetrahydrofolate cyclo-ligase [Cupriavidus gilardii]
MANAPTGPIDPLPSPPQPSSASGDPAAERRALRAALLERRASLPQRAQLDARIEAELAALLDWLPVRCLGFYWPIQQEFDARGLVARWLAAAPGRDAALPAVSRPAVPLDFHRWTPDTPMREGRYGIPVPDGTPAVAPDALLIPCVGFSAQKFRLGYGGGFYDRTLAALPGKPVAIGIGYESCRIDLAPGAHDIPMDWMVTENGRF